LAGQGLQLRCQVRCINRASGGISPGQAAYQRNGLPDAEAPARKCSRNAQRAGIPGSANGRPAGLSRRFYQMDKAPDDLIICSKTTRPAALHFLA
jgi:hypothetical protein